MKIEKIHIKSFGCIKDLTVEPSAEGITVIKGDNEAGKSTLCAFIKFIFYGLAQKEKWEGLSEKDRYISWNDSLASGNLTLVTSKNKHYRIEREILRGKRSSEQLNIIDLETGSLIKGQKPADLFLDGISPEVFVKTCFVTQHQGTKVEGKEVKGAVENMLTTGDEDVNTENALEIIDKARTRLIHKNEKGGMIFENSEQLREYIARRHEAAGTAENLKLLSDRIKEEKALLEQKKKQLADLERDIDITQAFARLEQINQAEAKAKELERLKEGFGEFTRENTANGFIPDARYKNELEKLNNRINYCKGHTEELAEQLAQYKKSRAALTEKSASAISANSKKDEHRGLLSKLSSFKKLLFAIIPVWVASLIMGIILSEFIFILTLAASVFLAFNIINLIKASNSLALIYGSVGAASEQDFGRLLKEYVVYSAKLDQFAGAEQSVSQGIAKTENEQKELEGEFDRLACKWNKDTKDREGFINEVDSFITQYAEKKNEIARKEADIQKIPVEYAHREIDELKKKTKGVTSLPIPLSMLFIKDGEKKAIASSVDALKSSIANNEKGVERILAAMPDLPFIDRQIEKLTDKDKKLKELLEGLKLAQAALKSAGENARNKFAPHITTMAAELTSRVTNGKYSSINIDPSLLVTYFDGNSTREISHLSHGTRAVIYTVFRMSLTSSLYSDIPPMVFDESLVSLDRNRLYNALCAMGEYCSSKDAQVFVFTCTDRETDILEDLPEIKSRVIRL